MIYNFQTMIALLNNLNLYTIENLQLNFIKIIRNLHKLYTKYLFNCICKRIIKKCICCIIQILQNDFLVNQCHESVEKVERDGGIWYVVLTCISKNISDVQATLVFLLYQFQCSQRPILYFNIKWCNKQVGQIYLHDLRYSELLLQKQIYRVYV